MKVQNTIEAIRVMQAFVDGRPIECAEVHKLNWGETLSPVWNWNNFTYRIKPNPTFRPWKPDEVPLGAQMRQTGKPQYRWLIDRSASDSHRKDWFNNGYEHSTDGGKTWHPCGVEEVE
jgi:hypothetical protein